MNAKELKEELENEEKYIIIDFDDTDSILNYDEAKPISEYKSKVNTDEFVKQIELLTEETSRTLINRGIPYNLISFSSNIIFLCKPEFVEKLKTYLIQIESDNSYDEDGVIFESLLNELYSNINLEYVPLRFGLNTAETGTKVKSIDDYMCATGLTYDDIYRKEVSGIVDFSQFISKMRDLGYSFKLLKYGFCTSIMDYIKSVQENGFDTYLSVQINYSK